MDGEGPCPARPSAAIGSLCLQRAGSVPWARGCSFRSIAPALHQGNARLSHGKWEIIHSKHHSSHSPNSWALQLLSKIPEARAKSHSEPTGRPQYGH